MAETPVVTLLGSPAIGPTGTDGILPGRRSELAFAFLAAHHGHLVTRDELAEALWPTGLPVSWAAAMRVVIAQVRRFLREAGWEDPDALVTLRSGYRLVLAHDGETDLDRIWDQTELASERLGAGDARGAVEAATYVTGRAGQPFLPDHAGAWVERTRQHLRQTLARALTVEAEGQAALGHRGASIEAASRLVEVEPLDDAAHRLRIRLLAQWGDVAGAVRAFNECRAVLAAELGVEPSVDTAAARWAEPSLVHDQQTPGDPDSLGRRGPDPRTSGGPLEGSRAEGGAEGGADLRGVQPAAPSPSRIGVLVVEDHDFQRRILVQVLRSVGVAWVESVADGVEALERLRRSPRPDLVLCDIDMPRMDGIEFVRHLGAEGGCTAIAFTSALEPAMLRSVEALSAGYGLEVLGKIPKPVTARSLRELLAGFTPQADRAPSPGSATRPAPDGLRRALGAGEVTAHFRPRLDLTTGTLSAAVISPVWRRSGVPVGADMLVDVATRSDLLHELVEVLLRRAARLLTSGATPGTPPAVVILLPPPLLCDVRLADSWADLLNSQRVDPGRIIVSIDVLEAPTGPTALDALTRLRLKGFGLALHGFDGSPSALDTCGRLPLTGLTIAARLVSGAADDPPREERLQRILDATRPGGLVPVADGCDRQEDLALLITLGFLEAQGHLIGPPMPARELNRWAVTAALPQP
jgi:DNA-binding SARP family transcriptional activator/EAL domain-containing protein (putative c-di-GMP-specific phosphodiesterase class I)